MSCVRITNLARILRIHCLMQIRGIRNDIRNSYTERSARGFTLPELLVSISIFVIITTAVVVNFRASEESGQLRLGAQTLASTLGALQNMAQTGRVTALCDTPPRAVCTGNVAICPTGQCSPAIPRGGYGIEISRPGGAITLFADGNADHLFSPGEALVDMRLNLPRNVIVDDAQSGPYDSQSRLTVAFEPPDPAVWINAARAEPEARIVVRHEKTGGTRSIILRAISGRIEVQSR